MVGTKGITMFHEIPTKRHISTAKAILAERYFLVPSVKFALQRIAEGSSAPSEYFRYLDQCLQTGDV